ncbi:MAG TPA: hypothetical protein VFO12_08860 [Sphingomicrobium sp.]|nr:hypothetical protein [Sphingomicrobium sp.]
MARLEPRWVSVFLKQLERTGNVRLAAERAGVDFSTAYQRRKRHGEFAEAWEASLAAFRQRPLHHPADGPTPPDKLREELAPPPSRIGSGMVPLPIASQQGGADLVARPDGKLIRSSDARWGKRAEEEFLTELTVSGNVRRAAEAAGFSTAAVYKRRMKDRHLAAAWDAAVETGKARVQAYLVEAATRTFDPEELPIGDEREVAKVSISEAINIARLKGPATSPGANGLEEEGDEDRFREVRERILDKLQRLKERDQRELGEAGWAEWPLPPRPGEEEGGTVWLPPDYRLVGPEA